MLPKGRMFYKMSGSGNDFVMVDATREPADEIPGAETVQAICARGTGVGADGLVLLTSSNSANFRMVYLNSDGSRADLCGNASLCSTRLAVELGIVESGQSEFAMETDAGVLGVRYEGMMAEVDLPAVVDVSPAIEVPLESGDQWIGYAVAGVPHIVVRSDDISTIDLVGRGRPLRFHSSLPNGANVNFVASGKEPEWQMRTYERGVEGETLACGTGAVSTAILLASHGEAGNEVNIRTRSGRNLRVRLRRDGECWYPSLSGEARLVFRGELAELGV